VIGLEALVRFAETSLPGVFVIDAEPHTDERGAFARLFCQEEFAQHGLCTDWAQTSISSNRRRGTLRGLHYQLAPHAEIKLIHCTRGAIYDVAIDLRRDSPMFGRWTALALAQDSTRLFYLPHGVAHGFQTLSDDAEVLYHISARGVRWDDPRLAIPWPVADPVLSERDRGLPLLALAELP
jgi:dTDP-4-dehydrorhamnose 3,5-epimerase